MRKAVTAGLAMLAALGTVLGCSSAGLNAAPVGPVTAASVTVTAMNAALAAPASTLMLQFNGISCLSAEFCAAVGAQGDTAHLARGNVPLAMIWTGTRWRRTAVPLAQGFPQGELFSISCTSPVYCVAVGHSVRGGYSTPLAETWNGRTWTAQALPRVTGRSYGASYGVSCAAARTCVATVSFTPDPVAGYALAETLNGTQWTLREVLLPLGGSGGFAGVSCLSTTHCVLAGDYGRQSHGLVLFESWDGRDFTPMQAISPESLLGIGGVSCASATSCAAIGATRGPANQDPLPLVEVWNGTTWSVVSVPGHKGLMTQLVGVSCGAATRCAAAGITNSTFGAEETSHGLALTYDGRSWTTASVPPLIHGGSSAFNAVSCWSAAGCVAVGEGGGPNGSLFSDAALTAFWNGKGWKLVGAS